MQKQGINPITFGQSIKSARKRQGLTQASLAGLCNTGTRFISELENGKTTCHLGLALKVAGHLGLVLRLEDPNA
jgi:HTH-type transcriptional regulator/antitoxin HipB